MLLTTMPLEWFFGLISFHLFIYFWLCWVFVAVLRFSLVSVSGAYSPVAVCGLLNVVAPLVTGRSF